MEKIIKDSKERIMFYYKKVLIKENIYKKVILCDINDNKISEGQHRKYIEISPDRFFEAIKWLPCGVELTAIPSVQTKPLFDDDYKIPINSEFGTHELIQRFLKIRALICDIFKVSPDNVLCYCRENIRPINNEEKKASFRYVINNHRISYMTMYKIMKHFKIGDNKPFDNIYNIHRVIHPIATSNKWCKNTKKHINVGTFLPFGENGFINIDQIDVKNYLCSYIEEDYIDLDEQFTYLNQEEKKKEEKKEDNESEPVRKHDLNKIISNLNPKRAYEYDDWCKGCWAIFNYCDDIGVKEKEAIDYADTFSQLNKDKYEKDANIYSTLLKLYEKRKTKGKKISFKTLCFWLKEDNPEYFKSICQQNANILDYEEQKLLFEQNFTKIMFPPMYIYKPDENDRDIEFMSEKNIKASQRHITARFIKKAKNANDEDTEKYDSFIENWLNDSNIRLYKYSKFIPPPLICPKDTYNTWCSFPIFNIFYDEDDKAYNDDVLKQFLDYGYGLLGEKEFRFILAYFANRLQNPANRTKVCVILYGCEGDGKNVFFDIFKGIFSPKYFHEVEKGNDLFKDHSYWELGRLFILINEGDPKDLKNNSEVLKARITSDTVNANPKGLTMFKDDNYCDYLMTTNNDDAININDKSRRYLICQTSLKYNSNAEFFISFCSNIVKCDKALRVIAEYLMNFNIAEVIPSGNFQKDMPKTEVMRELIENNMDYIERFLIEEKGAIIEKIDILNNIKTLTLFDLYRNWCDRSAIDNKMNRLGFAKRLARLIREKKWAFIEKYKDTSIKGYNINRQNYNSFVSRFINDE